MEAPQPYKTAALVNLASAGLLALWSLPFGLLLCWGVLPMAAAAFQGVVAWHMMQDEVHPHARNAAIAGIVGAVLACNPISLAGSVYALLQTQDDEVRGWIEHHGAPL